MNSVCAVVIGHVDHGKTSLVRALTGTDTDRLAEEKTRGMSILPGFAHCTYPAGTVDFIDAPGHEDFIQAMIGAASGAQVALLVVSAVEGIRAQTLEHLAIAELLGITRAVVIVSKSDLVAPPARAEEPTSSQADFRVALRRVLTQTHIADAPMIACSALTGEGIADVHAALQDVLEAAPTLRPTPCMLPIDRVFTRQGYGTVVTGTLIGTDISVGAEMMLQPAHRRVTVRSLQSRGESVQAVQAGARVAVNLRGVGVEEIARGAVLCTPEAGAPTTTIDVALTLLPITATPGIDTAGIGTPGMGTLGMGTLGIGTAGIGKPLRHMEEIRVSFGTTREVATLRLYSPKTGPTLAQLRFKKPVFGYVGQRAILRRLSPAQTLGSATFLDPQATPERAGNSARTALLHAIQTGAPLDIAHALAADNHGIADLRDVARLGRTDIPAARTALAGHTEMLAPDIFALTKDIPRHKAAFIEALAGYHSAHPLRILAPHSIAAGLKLAPLLRDHIEELLFQEGAIRRTTSGCATRGHDPIAKLSASDRVRLDAIEGTVQRAGLTPPLRSALAVDPKDTALTDLLCNTGRLVALENIALKQTLLFVPATLSAAAETLGAVFAPPAPFTTSQARDALGTSRKVIVPVLEHFDSIGITLRSGDTRRMSAQNPVPPAGTTR